MSLNKIILVIALGVSFHNAIISMEDEAKLEKHLKTSAADISSCVFSFVRGSENTPKYDSKEMETLGLWLTAQRNIISLDGEWNIQVDNLMGHVMFCRCHCFDNKATSAVCKVVKEVAKDLKPGQDCTSLLVERAQEAITIATNEWKEAQAKKNICPW